MGDAPAGLRAGYDTLIGVVRAHAIAQQHETGEALADDDATPLAVVTGVLLWALRLTLAPASTLTGFRGWVLEECPVAPGRRAITAAPAAASLDERRFPCPECRSVLVLPDGYCATAPGRTAARRTKLTPSLSPAQRRDGTKTSRFLSLVEDREGPLALIDPADVGRISRQLAHEADLDTGAARAALRRSVVASQNGHQS